MAPMEPKAMAAMARCRCRRVHHPILGSSSQRKIIGLAFIVA
jgi:hypothetical protein